MSKWRRIGRQTKPSGISMRSSSSTCATLIPSAPRTVGRRASRRGRRRRRRSRRTVRVRRDGAAQVVERCVGLAGERLEAGGVVLALPRLGSRASASSIVARARSVCPLGEERERNVEVLPPRRGEGLAGLGAGGEHDRPGLDRRRRAERPGRRVDERAGRARRTSRSPSVNVAPRRARRRTAPRARRPRGAARSPGRRRARPPRR